MKNYFGFALGVTVGCVALLVAQFFLKAPEVENPPQKVARRTFNPNRDAQQLEEALQRIAELEAQLESRAVAADVGGESGDAKPEAADGDSKAASFLEMMMSFGENEAQRKMETEVERIAGELDLSESQQVVLKEALAQRDKDQKSAGIRLMTGQASLDDLMNADEHNFTAVDSAIEAVLDEEQLLGYEGVKEAREIERIQTKTDEELGNLSKAADLTDEQQDAAWQVLADINAAEPPGQIPEGTTTEDFTALVDDALAKRVNGLAPILDEDQLGVYEGQTEDFRKMVMTLIGSTVSSGDE